MTIGRPHFGGVGALSLALGSWLAGGPAFAEPDAARGAALYLQLPSGAPSCVSCHGPDPAASRNNLLRAADQPTALLKALGAVGVMGYLKPLLDDAAIEDLAAYLGRVARTAATAGQPVWPRTVEFGTLVLGAASPVHVATWRNDTGAAVTGVLPRLAAGRFLVEHDCVLPLPAGASCRVALRALAGEVGALNDALLWGPAPGAVLGLSATVSAAPAAALTLEGEGGLLDFGTVAPGSPAARQLVLRNSGSATATLGVSTLTGPGAAAIASEGCGAGTVLPPGAACTMDLRFSPAVAGAYEALLQWRSDGANPAPLRMIGQAGPAPAGDRPLPPAAPVLVDGGGGGGGGGGCAAAPAAARGDATLLLLALLSALACRRRRRDARNDGLSPERHRDVTDAS